VEERGWGWSDSETRQAELVEWLVGMRSFGPYFLASQFYGAHPDQSINVLGDLRSLQDRSLIHFMGGSSIESIFISATPEGQAFAKRLKAARASNHRRRDACRDAMVDWLYSRDALSPPGVDRGEMLKDQRGYFFAMQFTADDLDAAASWLYRNSLVGGSMIAEAKGPVVLYLTDSGVKCAEDFRSDTIAYLERQQYRASGPTVNIGTNNGPFQVAGDYARQVQNIETTANDLRQLITGITTTVRTLVPDVPDADIEEQAALAAVSDQGVDLSALERFRAWTVRTVSAGANAAAVGVVSSATTTLLLEAVKLAGHLG
jgi:hypothetical protein